MGIQIETAKACVGPGWENLIDKLFQELPSDVLVLDVKEKWGGLRVYVSHEPSAVDELIFELEAESLETCEKCGDPGLPRNGGWIKTLCDQCHTERLSR